MQDRFMGSERDVVLATNAFGMGVDKPDIRFVLHSQVPRTLEAWAQEVGRAGRDGDPSWCELFYREEDLAIQQRFIQWANPSLEYLVGVFEVLRGWGERIQIKELDDLRAELLVKERRDNRVGICLKWLEVLGLSEGSFETRDLRLVGELDPSDLPDFVGSGEKLQGDLQALLGMVRFARDGETCRRVLLARHFGLEEPQPPCGACDSCVGAADWRGERFEQRPQSSAEPAAGGRGAGQDEPVRRGDWVRVGRHLGQVVRVEGEGPRARVVVESASDLRRRTVDARRVRRVEP